jgi:small-conductance mechanosensitive channel
VTVQDVWELLVDTESAGGLGVTSVTVLLAALAVRVAAVPLARRRFRDDPYRRYWAGKVTGYAIGALTLVVLVVLWAPLGGRLSVVLGFATAGVAFAMQEVIGALFGWLNILAGRIYDVGDRIEVGGVRGDVIDVSPLRTKVLETGGDAGGDGARTPVTARQLTGRVVSVSNKRTFTEAVSNSSAQLDWIWEELTLPIGQDGDWRRAEEILLEEVRAEAPALREEGERALARLDERYLVSTADVAPHAFVRLRDGDLEVTARFVVAVRHARVVKDAVTRRVLARLADEGIALAYPTTALTGELRTRTSSSAAASARPWPPEPSSATAGTS